MGHRTRRTKEIAKGIGIMKEIGLLVIGVCAGLGWGMGICVFKLHNDLDRGIIEWDKNKTYEVRLIEK